MADDTETTNEQWREDYDWIEAFGYAGQPDTCATVYQSGPDLRRAHPTATEPSLQPFTIADVASVEAMSEGENGDRDWLCLGVLNDGRWFLLAAGCDYTGWDCQAGGTTTLATSRDELLAYGTTTVERERLGLAAADVSARP